MSTFLLPSLCMTRTLFSHNIFIQFLVFSMTYYQVKLYFSGPLCDIWFLKYDYKHEHDYINKQLLDEVSVISRIVKVGLRVTSRQVWLITLTKTLIILDITKTESNFIVLSYIGKNKWKSCFCLFTDGKQHKVHKLDMITCGLECP